MNSAVPDLYLRELEVRGKVGPPGPLGKEEGGGNLVEGGDEGQFGDRGLLEVKNSWTVGCCRTWLGRPVRHLGETSHVGATKSDILVNGENTGSCEKLFTLLQIFDI